MERQRGKVVPENCALLGYHAAVPTRYVIAQKERSFQLLRGGSLTSCKVVPVYAKKTYRDTGGIALLILKLRQ